VALMARDRGGPPIAFQLLVYPVIDHRFDTPSYRENAEGYVLWSADMEYYWRHYLADERDGSNPYASPIRAESLAGLPPALVITAEMDPLRDEGEAYAARLREDGVPTTCTRYDGMIHGFFGMGSVLEQGRRAIEEAGRALREAFAGAKAGANR
jgi:acetyl esterase